MINFEFVRVIGCGKRTKVTNPISGHSWTEYGDIKTWEVRGPLGHISNHRSEAAALKAAEEWDAFYKKFPGNLPQNS